MTSVLRLSDLISQGKISGKRVFIRADLNVPQDDAGNITEDTRIRASVPAIEACLAGGAAVMVTSHLGRPTEGEFKPEDSLAPIATRLSELLGKPVKLVQNWVDGVEVAPGQVVLLENCRVNKGEKKNSDELAQKMAKLCDVYVNDAFGAAHRAHASVEALVKLVPEAGAGLLMEKELKYLGQALEHPARPFVAILGGAKVSDKIEVIENLIPRVDRLIIGGAMAYTFFKAMNKPVGTSLVEDDKLDSARDIMTRAQQRNLPLLLPLDHVVAPKLEAGAPSEVLLVDDGAIGDRMGLDIGPKTAAAYADALKDAHTVVWNGPMGVFEIDAFAQGTIAVAQAVAGVKGTTIIGGGDSIAAVKKAGVAGKITHISTGGGASLEWLGGRTLPGVAVLPEA